MPGPYPAPLHLQYGEDTPHVSGDLGYLLLGIKQSGLSTLSDTDGDYTPVQIDANGSLRVINAQPDPTDSNGSGYGAQVLYDGSVFFRARGTVPLTVLASAARVATTNSADLVNYNNLGLMLFVNITARAVATTLTPFLQIKDPVSGTYFTIWTAAAAINSAAGAFAYLFAPGAPAAVSWTEAKETLVAAKTFRVGITHSDANSITYSVGGAQLVG